MNQLQRELAWWQRGKTNLKGNAPINSFVKLSLVVQMAPMLWFHAGMSQDVCHVFQGLLQLWMRLKHFLHTPSINAHPQVSRQHNRKVFTSLVPSSHQTHESWRWHTNTKPRTLLSHLQVVPEPVRIWCEIATQRAHGAWIVHSTCWNAQVTLDSVEATKAEGLRTLANGLCVNIHEHHQSQNKCDNVRERTRHKPWFKKINYHAKLDPHRLVLSAMRQTSLPGLQWPTVNCSDLRSATILDNTSLAKPSWLSEKSHPLGHSPSVLPVKQGDLIEVDWTISIDIESRIFDKTGENIEGYWKSSMNLSSGRVPALPARSLPVRGPVSLPAKGQQGQHVATLSKTYARSQPVSSFS